MSRFAPSRFTPASPDTGTRGATWTPALLLGLAFEAYPDLAATLTLVSSTHISQMKDAAGGSLLLTEATDSARPLLDGATLLNGRKSMRLTSAASSSLFTTSGGGATPCSVGVVARFDALGTFRLLAAFGQTATGHTFGASAISGAYWAGGASHIAAQSSVDSLSGSAAYSTNGAGDSGLATDTTTAHLIYTVQDGAHTRLYVDGYLCLPNLNGGSGGVVAETYPTLSTGLGFIAHSASFCPDAHVWHAVFCTVASSAADRRRYEAWNRSTFGASLAYSIAGLPQLLMGVDSLSYGSGAVHGTSDPLTLLAPLLSVSVKTWNLGIPGRTLATAAANVEYDIAGHTTGLAPANVYIDLSGVNDISAYIAGGGSDVNGYAATLHTARKSYWTAAKAQSPGLKIVTCTLFHTVSAAGNPITNIALFNQIVDAFNALLVADYAGADALCDLGADANIVANLSATDGLHPTATGNGYIAADLEPVVNPLLL